MCGIAGIIHSDPSRFVSPESVRSMCDAIVHRGPDGAGQYVNGHVGIGMRRLSIIDLHTGQQPITNEDGTIWVVFNGEIYNYRELRKDLKAKGHRFRTTSDTEVIVHLFEEMGEECVQRLRGMFAFAIWDARRKFLLLGRDRLGIKPLYYAAIPEGLIFASELKALLTHPGIPRDLDPQAVTEYFTHLCVPGDLSIFKSVRKLPPAHVLTYRQGQVELRRYWQVQPNPDHSRNENDWTEELRDRLRDAVDIHMVADVPVGAFLSGGLDSGMVVALMARASTEPVRTFTVGFATDAGAFDEREPARAVAQRYGTIHEECLLEPDVAEILPRIVHAFDEPFADSSAIPNWLICRETARHVKVALSGLGGDELFGGYERYVGLQSGELYQKVPRPVRLAISRLVRDLPNGSGTSYGRDRLKRFVAASELSPAGRYRSFIAAFGNVDDILHPDLRALLNHRMSRYQQVISELAIREALDVGLFTDLYLYLPDDLLTLTDRVSMAHSLEIRVPFLDHELVEFVARMPGHLKVRGLQKKFLFRKAVAPWVPEGHLHRRKQGFSIPLGAWLKGPLKPMLSDLVESRESRESPWLNHTAVRKLVEEHLAGKQNHEIRLWAIICFQEWKRQYAGAQAHNEHFQKIPAILRAE
jgi:asparagine synthase (glutamine-hydrolysing)